MTQQLLILAVILLPGILAHYYYQFIQKKEETLFNKSSRIIIISVLSYVFRGLIGIFQGYGDAKIMVYFDNVDNMVKYIIISIISSFLLVNSYIYLEQVFVPKLSNFFIETEKEGDDTDEI